MSARIARGAAPRAKPRGKTQVRGKKGKPAESPFSEWVRKASWWIFLFMVVAVVLAALVAVRVPQMIGTSIGESIGQAVMRSASFLFFGAMKKYYPVPASDVADAMLKAAKEKRSGINVIQYDEMVQLISHPHLQSA